jgi:hypothetical protein
LVASVVALATCFDAHDPGLVLSQSALGWPFSGRTGSHEAGSPAGTSGDGHSWVLLFVGCGGVHTLRARAGAWLHHIVVGSVKVDVNICFVFLTCINAANIGSMGVI